METKPKQTKVTQKTKNKKIRIIRLYSEALIKGYKNGQPIW